MRAIVNVATTRYYQRGQARLEQALTKHMGNQRVLFWGVPEVKPVWPGHDEKPYAFKAYALMAAAQCGANVLLWCDASILPIRSLEPLWQRIERDGYWMSEGGWNNYEWTADSAYPDLFAHLCYQANPLRMSLLNLARAENRNIPHVAATAFGLNLAHPMGDLFLQRYFELASETKAFCGPWINAAHPDWLAQPGAQERPMGNGRVAVCGPPDVRGHRHDQTAASVIAYRLAFTLTKPPEIFAYKGGETEQTILVADGSYV